MPHRIDRRNIPQAHAFRVTECGDPNCGPHIIAMDDRDRPIVEITMSRAQGLAVIKSIQDILYKKAVGK